MTSTQTADRPLEWWQTIELATVRELSRLRASGKIASPIPRTIVSIGWDGNSKPMLRYEDELDLPDSMRSVVERPARLRAPAKPAERDAEPVRPTSDRGA